MNIQQKFSLANYQDDYLNFMQESLQQRDVFLPTAKAWEQRRELTAWQDAIFVFPDFLELQ